MKTVLLVALLVTGAAALAAVPTAAASHRVCDVYDAGCMAECAIGLVVRHPCSLRAFDLCEFEPTLCPQ